MTSRPISLALGLAAAATLACATPANAYTYTFINGSKQTVTQIWMHTQSVFCHDVTWRGSLPPGGRVKVSTASICLVDRVEILNGPSWSSATGHASGFFVFNSNKVCLSDIGLFVIAPFLNRC